MSEQDLHKADYFIAPELHFWKWTDAGRVVQWRGGDTICYRDDLVNILRQLEGYGLIPISSLLLVLYSCRKSLDIQKKYELLGALQLSGGEEKYEAAALYKSIDDAVELSRIIEALPHKYRSDNARVHLLHTLFTEKDFVLSNQAARKQLDDLASGRMDDLLAEQAEVLGHAAWLLELAPLCKALERFPTAEKLEMALGTGVTKAPAPVQITIEEEGGQSLLDQLSKDDQTAGLAKLARRLVALLQIPLHSTRGNDMSFGGISDISNRGNYDQLLLTELAYDTDLLSVRLVNNEALYYRREQPPDNPRKRKIILIDETLRLWGLPRVFALASALAFVQKQRKGEQMEAWALVGDRLEPIDIHSKKGVLQALTVMSPDLHAAGALYKAGEQFTQDNETELLLVTFAANMSHPAFAAAVQAVRSRLSYLVTVDREGTVEFSSINKGRTKLLGKAVIDANEWLHVPSGVRTKKTGKKDEYKPAFFDLLKAPLLLPIHSAKSGKYFGNQQAALLVGTKRRLLYVPKYGKGAVELLPEVPGGSYIFGLDDSAHAYLLVWHHVNGKNKFRFFTIGLREMDIQMSETETSGNVSRYPFFKNGIYYYLSEGKTIRYDAYTHQLLEPAEAEQYHKLAPPHLLGRPAPEAYNLEPILRPGYNIITKALEVGIDEKNGLRIGRWQLDISKYGSPHGETLYLSEIFRGIPLVAKARGGSVPVDYYPNRQIRFSEFRWTDGTILVIDSRGLLHLRSGNQSLHEISFTFVTGINLACWSSSGEWCGNSYFLPAHFNPNKIIPEQQFYEKYFTPIIEYIRRNAVTTEI